MFHVRPQCMTLKIMLLINLKKKRRFIVVSRSFKYVLHRKFLFYVKKFFYHQSSADTSRFAWITSYSFVKIICDLLFNIASMSCTFYFLTHRLDKVNTFCWVYLKEVEFGLIIFYRKNHFQYADNSLQFCCRFHFQNVGCPRFLILCFFLFPSIKWFLL